MFGSNSLAIWITMSNVYLLFCVYTKKKYLNLAVLLLLVCLY